VDAKINKKTKKLWSHQQDARMLASKSIADGFGILHDIGTGKTCTMIHILKDMYQKEGRILPTLIICPLSVVYNWQREFEQFAPELLAETAVAVGTAKQKYQMFDSEHKIIITNFDTFRAPRTGTKRLFEMLVVDESHFCKNPSANRTKNIHNLADLASYRYILTGTPITKNYMDLWGQFRIISKFIFGKSFYHFKHKYFYNKNAGKSWFTFPDWAMRDKIVPEGISAKEHIEQKLKIYSHRATKAEALDLPELVRVKYDVELTPELKKIYDEVKKSFVSFLDDYGNAKISVDLVLTQIMRLQQIANGIVKLDDSDEPVVLATAKTKCLKELLEQITQKEKVIVWSCFIPNYAQISDVCKNIRLEYSMLVGSMNAKEKQASIDRFNTDTSCKVMIANQGAGGTGINLIATSTMIYFSKNYDWAKDEQSQGRCYRGGSEMHKQITRIDIVTRNTIEQDITSALKHKMLLNDFIMNLKNKGD